MNPFTDIKFNEADHTYFLNGQELQSVTSFIKKYQKPFDRDGIAAKVAERDGKSIKQVLAEWDAKRQASQEKGTRVHRYIEKVIRGETATSDPFLSLNNNLPEMTAFDQLWETLKAKVELAEDYHLEWVIGDAHSGKAGTADVLFYGNETGVFHLWDWKTGKFEVDNRFQKLLPPFDDLDDCQLNVHSMQISLYRYIIERNTELEVGDCYLVHLSKYGYQVHKALDLRDRFKYLAGEVTEFQKADFR